MPGDTPAARRDPRLWHHHFPALRINRQVLEEARRRLQSLRRRPVVLDAGCGQRPFERLFGGSLYVGNDVDLSARPSVVADNAELPFRDGVFDLVIASETLEHTLRHEQAVSEFIRVTRPGGYIFVSVPFMYPVHGAPFDFQRFTEFKLARLFHSCEIVEFAVSNSVFSSWVLMLEYAVSTLASRAPFLMVLPVISAVLNSIALALDSVIPPLVLLVIRFFRRPIRYRSRGARGLPLALVSMPSGYALLVRKPSLESQPSALRDPESGLR
jgi:SAM-dependent methyltransferase